jgi:hypothetical protein
MHLMNFIPYFFGFVSLCYHAQVSRPYLNNGTTKMLSWAYIDLIEIVLEIRN